MPTTGPPPDGKPARARASHAVGALMTCSAHWRAKSGSFGTTAARMRRLTSAYSTAGSSPSAAAVAVALSSPRTTRAPMPGTVPTVRSTSAPSSASLR